jgi:hypothetical protein
MGKRQDKIRADSIRHSPENAVTQSILPCILFLIAVTLASARVSHAQTQTVTPEQLCRHVKEIRTLPLKPGGPNEDNSSVDSIYGQMRKMGNQVVPCLIEKITDITEMDDPRQAPAMGKVKVGDVALWVVLDITGLPYDDMFPPDVRKRLTTEGVYAYFEWVKSSKHRNLLQQNVRAWYSRNHG